MMGWGVERFFFLNINFKNGFLGEFHFFLVFQIYNNVQVLNMLVQKTFVATSPLPDSDIHKEVN